MMTANEKSLIYKEKATHGTLDFPFGFYEIVPDAPWDGFGHHWHDELEILYFEEGGGCLQVNMQPYPVTPERFYFINPRELHSLSALVPCREYAVLFHPRMLCFDTYDSSQSRLIQPLLNGKLSFPHQIASPHPAFPALKREYLDIVSAYHHSCGDISEDISSQLYIKAGLLKILAILSSHGLLGSSAHADTYKARMIKAALSYISAHYQEKVYVRDLAGQVNMNEQYFCRFFKEAIGQTPVSCLNKYRIRKALPLLRETDMAVIDICLQCGFNNFGNFLREFKKYTGTTPLQYRKNSECHGRPAKEL